MNFDTPLAAALAYASWGWSVIPLGRDKRPFFSWKEFQARRADEDEIRAWFSRWPEANVGVVTGAISGIFVLDVDSDEGLRVVDEQGGLPDTPFVLTGKGRHFYFPHPGEHVRTCQKALPGCDLRGDGGYVMAPPSVHPSGAIYEWIGGGDGNS